MTNTIDNEIFEMLQKSGFLEQVFDDEAPPVPETIVEALKDKIWSRNFVFIHVENVPEVLTTGEVLSPQHIYDTIDVFTSRACRLKHVLKLGMHNYLITAVCTSVTSELQRAIAKINGCCIEETHHRIAFTIYSRPNDAMRVINLFPAGSNINDEKTEMYTDINTRVSEWMDAMNYPLPEENDLVIISETGRPLGVFDDYEKCMEFVHCITRRVAERTIIVFIKKDNMLFTVNVVSGEDSNPANYIRQHGNGFVKTIMRSAVEAGLVDEQENEGGGNENEDDVEENNGGDVEEGEDVEQEVEEDNESSDEEGEDDEEGYACGCECDGDKKCKLPQLTLTSASIGVGLYCVTVLAVAYFIAKLEI